MFSLQWPPCLSRSQLHTAHPLAPLWIHTKSFKETLPEKDQSQDKPGKAERKNKRGGKQKQTDRKRKIRTSSVSWPKRRRRRFSETATALQTPRGGVGVGFHRFIILETKLTMAEAGWSMSSSANRWLTLSVVLPCFLATNPKSFTEPPPSLPHFLSWGSMSQ